MALVMLTCRCMEEVQGRKREGDPHTKAMGFAMLACKCIWWRAGAEMREG